MRSLVLPHQLCFVGLDGPVLDVDEALVVLRGRVARAVPELFQRSPWLGLGTPAALDERLGRRVRLAQIALGDVLAKSAATWASWTHRTADPELAHLLARQLGPVVGGDLDIVDERGQAG